MPLLKQVNSLEIITIDRISFYISTCFENIIRDESSDNSDDKLWQRDEESSIENISIDDKQENKRICCKDKLLIEFFVGKLTSHANRRLHDVLFKKMLVKFTAIYMKHKLNEIGKLIRFVISSFINFSLLELDFEEYKMFAETLMFQDICANLKNCRSLEKLVLGRTCFGRSNSLGSLTLQLKHLINLKVLHIHYVCSPDMLRGLAENCPVIREISLKGSRDIGDSEVELIASFTLDTLDLRGTSFTGMGALQLLYLMPSIEWFYHCPFNCPSDTIIFESRERLFEYIRNVRKQMSLQRRNAEEIPGEEEDDVYSNLGKNRASSSVLSAELVDLKKEEERSSALGENLKFFWLFNPGDREMESIRLCPKLKHLTLDFVMQDLEDEPSFESLSLNHLEKLTLKAYDKCQPDFVMSILKTCPQLASLSVFLGDDWFFSAPIQSFIVTEFPMLTELHMGGDYMGSQPLNESDSLLTSDPYSSLPLLETLSLCGCITNARLLHLLRAAPNIRSLTLDGEMDALTDEVFSTAVNEGLLCKLENLWINVSSSISLSTVLLLLSSSNELRRIGRLCQMSSSSKEQYQSLLKFVREFNYDTELIWVTDQRMEKKE